MRASTSWQGADDGPYAALVYPILDFTPGDATDVCLGIARGKSGLSLDIAKIVTGPATLTPRGVPPFLASAHKAGASEIHVIAASSAEQAAAIREDLKPE